MPNKQYVVNTEKTGAKIRELMESMNIPPKYVAHVCNVTVQCVSKWVNGKGLPNYRSLKTLASLLGRENMDDLLVFDIKEE